ncbi:hypothetical protein [Legionella cardiaca]|uniref:Dot/Icm T4SS effector n=1 Tax=Legionella cardiaca TaxID=1071983 RepID=A0ABY8AXI5_9GAMM|nr:hypothetical protein [Legionella cardiaca]WED43857.1 hypothetical protein PXX05_03490 [Legionella cardiaca]
MASKAELKELKRYVESKTDNSFRDDRTLSAIMRCFSYSGDAYYTSFSPAYMNSLKGGESPLDPFNRLLPSSKTEPVNILSYVGSHYNMFILYDNTLIRLEPYGAEGSDTRERVIRDWMANNSDIRYQINNTPIQREGEDEEERRNGWACGDISIVYQIVFDHMVTTQKLDPREENVAEMIGKKAKEITDQLTGDIHTEKFLKLRRIINTIYYIRDKKLELSSTEIKDIVGAENYKVFKTLNDMVEHNVTHTLAATSSNRDETEELTDTAEKLTDTVQRNLSRKSLERLKVNGTVFELLKESTTSLSQELIRSTARRIDEEEEDSPFQILQEILEDIHKALKNSEIQNIGPLTDELEREFKKIKKTETDFYDRKKEAVWSLVDALDFIVDNPSYFPAVKRSRNSSFAAITEFLGVEEDSITEFLDVEEDSITEFLDVEEDSITEFLDIEEEEDVVIDSAKEDANEDDLEITSREHLPNGLDDRKRMVGISRSDETSKTLLPQSSNAMKEVKKQLVAQKTSDSSSLLEENSGRELISEDHKTQIQELISILKAETRGCLFFHRERKNTKIEALKMLLTKSTEYDSVEELVDAVIKANPDAIKGIFSNRTGSLLTSIRNSKPGDDEPSSDYPSTSIEV